MKLEIDDLMPSPTAEVRRDTCSICGGSGKLEHGGLYRDACLKCAGNERTT